MVTVPPVPPQAITAAEDLAAEAVKLNPDAVDAVEATLHAYLGPWLAAEAHGTALSTQIRTAAALAVRDALPHLAAAATAELKANLQAAIDRVEHTAAAAQAKAIEHAVATAWEACAQLADKHHAWCPGKPLGPGRAEPGRFFSDMLREAQP